MFRHILVFMGLGEGSLAAVQHAFCPAGWGVV